MENKFGEIFSSLRKKRGISQKQAAADLGVSQALLSHYERGIRECGLNFLMQAADYYGVTCDYLLGHSTQRSARTVEAAEQRKLMRTLELIQLLLERSANEKLKNLSYDYLRLSFYKILRMFDGICVGLEFYADTNYPSVALVKSQLKAVFAESESKNLEKSSISIHEHSLEPAIQLIGEAESIIK